MKPYCEMNRQELLELKESLKAEYNDYQKRKLSLNMARGKPSQEQLNLSMGMMDVLSSDSDLTCEDGTDCRNYGVLDGIEEAKELMADMMEVRPDQVIIYGNSSLNVMYDTVARSMISGVTFSGLSKLSVSACASAIMMYISSKSPVFCNCTLRLSEPT